MRLKKHKNKIPFKLKILRLKNKGLLTFTDKIISLIKPPKTYNGIIKKILFIRSDRIGDAIVTLPVFRDIKFNYPGIQIHVVTSSKNRFVFEDLPFIDKIFTFGINSNLRRVFEFDVGYSKKINISYLEQKLFNLFLFGHFIHFIIYCFVPFILNKNFRNEIHTMKSESYDIVFDLKGSKRIALTSKMISKFTAGSRMFGFSWLYSYYTNTNWVSQTDSESMTKKIECFVAQSSGLVIKNRDTTVPYLNIEKQSMGKKLNDIFFHIGTSELRKLSIEQETHILNSLKGKNVIVTDSNETKRFSTYKERYNYIFKLYNKIEDCIEDLIDSKLVICYDGGQAHYLSQFGKTIVIFGPGSVHLWKPYEFEDYEILINESTSILKSKGNYGHLAIFKPIWCSPCFDIGCKEKPCLNKLDIKLLIKLISENN